MGYINRLFFRKDTGNLIHRYMMQGDIIVPSLDQDLSAIASLSGYNLEAITVIEIVESDATSIEKINSCTGIRLDLITNELIFDYTPQQINEVQEKADKVQEDYIQPTLLNLWVLYYGLGYFKDEFGIVHVDTVIKSGAIAAYTNLFILPVGYRPLESIARSVNTFSSTSDITPITLEIITDGRVRIYGTAKANININFSFRAGV